MSKKLPIGLYAKAYLRAMGEERDGYGELVAAERVLRTTPPLRAFLSDRSIEKDERLKAVKTALPDIQSETTGLILLLGEHGVLKKLERVAEAVRIAYESTGIAYVHAASAIPLLEKEKGNLASILKRRTGKTIRLTHSVDPSLIGGLLIRCGDWSFDATVLGHIKRLKRQLTL